MAIAYVRTAGTNGGSSFSFDIGTAGTDRLVVISVGRELDSLLPVTAISVDGKSCTLIENIFNDIGIGIAQQMWYIDEAALGSSAGSVTVAVTGTVTSTAIQALLFTGVRSGGPTDSGFDNTSGATDTITVNGIDCPKGGLAVGGWGQGSASPGVIQSITSPQVERYIVAPSSATLAGSSGVESAAVTNKTYILTWTNPDQFRGTGIIAVWPPVAKQTHQMLL